MPALFEELCTLENLYHAFRAARRGKRSQPYVAAFEYDLEGNLLGLQQELRSRGYRPGRYQSFHIHEPKRRLISAAPFHDRVVHHALVRVIEPLFERRFVFDSYANRKGKGTHRALDRCTHFLRRYRYVLPLDLVQFFPAIDHAILKETFSRQIPDRDVHWLCQAILDSGRGVLAEEYQMVWFPGDDLLAASRPRGLPIGNLTSQFWANCYLDPLDHFIKRRLQAPGYVRYVDDLLLFSDDPAALWRWRAAIESRLADLRLTLHPGSAHPRPTDEGLPFLGFTVFPDHRRLKRRKAVFARRRLAELWREVRTGQAPRSDFEASMRAWLAHAAHGDTWGLRRSVLRGLRQ